MVNLNLPADSNISVVVDKLFPPKVRLAIYVVVFLIAAVLVIIGIVTEDEASKWLFLIGNILGIGGTGLAVLNRPREIKGE